MKRLSDVLAPEEHADFYEALNRVADRSIRLHVDAQGCPLPFETTPVDWHPLGRWITDSKVRPGAFLNHAVAQYYIQDAASLLALTLLDAAPGERISDLCAAPGGKASAISETIGPSGILIANETIRSRVAVLHYVLARAGRANYLVTSLDPDELASNLSQSMDAVLVDAPCSGQTLVAKKKRDASAFDPRQIEHCAARQERILDSAVRMLRPGGRLIYSTCTFAIEENEAQIMGLCDRYPGYFQPISHPLLEPWQSDEHPGCYRLWPHRHRCAGGFAAGLRLISPIEAQQVERVQGSEAHARSERRKVGSDRRHDKHARTAQTDGDASLDAWGELSTCKMRWGENGADLVRPSIADFMDEKQMLRGEPLLGMVHVGKHWVPSHGLALVDRSLFQPHHSMELADAFATRYCHGQALEVADASASRQWVVANWNHRPLGWCHAAGNRLNNHLPPWARWT